VAREGGEPNSEMRVVVFTGSQMIGREDLQPLEGFDVVQTAYLKG
jgi:hypothetical protein